MIFRRFCKSESIFNEKQIWVNIQNRKAGNNSIMWVCGLRIEPFDNRRVHTVDATQCNFHTPCLASERKSTSGPECRPCHFISPRYWRTHWACVEARWEGVRGHDRPAEGSQTSRPVCNEADRACTRARPSIFRLKSSLYGTLQALVYGSRMKSERSDHSKLNLAQIVVFWVCFSGSPGLLTSTGRF